MSDNNIEIKDNENKTTSGNESAHIAETLHPANARSKLPKYPHQPEHWSNEIDLQTPEGKPETNRKPQVTILDREVRSS